MDSTDENIILYDDPTAGLDPVLSDSIADLMIDTQRSLNTTSIVTTHDLKVAEKIADKVLLLYDCKRVFYGDSQEFFSKSTVYSEQFISGNSQGPIDLF